MKRNRVKLKKVVIKSFCLFLVAAVMVAISSARSHARLIEFAFGGVVTDVVIPEPPNDPLPAPWDEVQVGDGWSIMYTFESSTPRTFVEEVGGGVWAYDGAVTTYVFTVIRDDEVIGKVSNSPPTISWIYVLDGGDLDPPLPGSVGDRYSIQIRDTEDWDQGFWMTLKGMMHVDLDEDSETYLDPLWPQVSAVMVSSVDMPLDGDIRWGVTVGNKEIAGVQFGRINFPIDQTKGGFNGPVMWHTSRDVYTSYSGPGGGCSIATAAYSSSMAKHVKVLRDFCDRFLLESNVGKALVEFYYKYSPPIADYIAKNANLRAIVRLGLLPVVGICWATLELGLFTTIALIFFCIIGLIRLISFIRRKKINSKYQKTIRSLSDHFVTR
jgi:hypothetical protein